MNNYQLTIGYLYPDLMNIYGDTGNIIALQKRAQWRGIKIKIKNITIGDRLKAGECDLYFFGGGQDQGQVEVAKDIANGKGKLIKTELDRGVPSLSICGGYQLLGAYYKPQKGPKIPGLGFFPTYTQAGEKRMIGNIVVQLSHPELDSGSDIKLIGFENHSGKTFLDKKATPLGKVIKGFGNNGQDQTEGIIYKNSIGCYMHGSLLPKNPVLADWLIQKALEIKYGKTVELEPLDDTLETLAHTKTVKRFG